MHYSRKHQGNPPFLPTPKTAIRKSTRVLKRIPRQLYNVEDARLIGNHNNKTSILYVGPSKLPKAGNGVFTRVTLYRGDIVTIYDGKYSATVPDDTEYTMRVRGGFLDGIRTPTKRYGYGSLINRPNRNSKKANISFEEVGLVKGKPQVVVQVTRTIKAGSELLGHYGRGYIINK
jgi:hypothetical protein